MIHPESNTNTSQFYALYTRRIWMNMAHLNFFMSDWESQLSLHDKSQDTLIPGSGLESCRQQRDVRCHRLLQLFLLSGAHRKCVQPGQTSTESGLVGLEYIDIWDFEETKLLSVCMHRQSRQVTHCFCSIYGEGLPLAGQSDSSPILWLLQVIVWPPSHYTLIYDIIICTSALPWDTMPTFNLLFLPIIIKVENGFLQNELLSKIR